LLFVKPRGAESGSTSGASPKARSAVNVTPFVGFGSAGVEGTF
jgi:hypothetical protein